LARKVLMRMDLMGVAGPESPEQRRDVTRKTI
jgi:hypothetical protein